MPTLPDITVTQAQYDLLAQFLPGDTPAQKAAAYRDGTKDFWRRQVIDARVRQAEADAQEALEAAREAADSDPDNI